MTSLTVCAGSCGECRQCGVTGQTFRKNRARFCSPKVAHVFDARMFGAMEIDEAVTMMRRVDAVRHAPVDLASIKDATGKIFKLRAWLDGCEAELAAATVGRSPTPARDIAAAGRTSERVANRVIERADTASSVPALGKAMADGDVSGGHLDAVTAGVKSLAPAQRQRLRQRAGELVAKASESTVDEFRELIQDEARKIMEDDGIARLDRQRRACRLQTWTSKSDGMWRLSGSFDPETGLKLSGRLSNMLSKLFAEPAPPEAPSDPGERTDFLRAMALVKLTEGGGGVAGRPEIIVVVDTRDGADADADPLTATYQNGAPHGQRAGSDERNVAEPADSSGSPAGPGGQGRSAEHVGKPNSVHNARAAAVDDFDGADESEREDGRDVGDESVRGGVTASPASVRGPDDGAGRVGKPESVHMCGSGGR